MSRLYIYLILVFWFHGKNNVFQEIEILYYAFSYTGKNLMQYVILFFPPQSMRRFKARRCYKDRVLMPTICCLHKCVNLEELYLEKADSSGITSYLLAHILKFLIRLRVLALPKQCDDDVASVIGLNCPKLECIILTGTSVTNQGLSWLLCCRQLHTVIMPGFLQGKRNSNILLKLHPPKRVQKLDLTLNFSFMYWLNNFLDVTAISWPFLHQAHIETIIWWWW